MENLTNLIRQQAEDVISKLGVQDVVTPKQVAESILNQVAYWEKPLPNGEKLLFIRFFSPVVQREEVFLGNILFNDFLSKAFARAVTLGKLGKAELVANDLENYYFLVRTTSDVAQLAEVFRIEVEYSLPGLFFDKQDEARGIYGSLETMLAFEKANVEPFPVFIMPGNFEARLEKTVRESLLRKIENSPMDRNPTSIMANLSFFYCRDGAEMQSPYLFLARLLLQYGVVDVNDFRQAFNLDDDVKLEDAAAVKLIIKDSLMQSKGRTFSSIQLRRLLKQVVTKLGEKVESDPENWRMPYIRSKFLNYDNRTLINKLLDGVSLGYQMLSSRGAAVNIGCRVCGVKTAETEDKSILMGQDTHRFHNQSGKQKNEEDPKACLRCAISTYLIVKLIGSEAVGQPQVPKNYNLIFHYGKHPDEEVNLLVQQIDLIWSLVRQYRDTEYVRREVAEQVRELQTKHDREQDDRKRQALVKVLAQKEVELKEAQLKLKETGSEIFNVCPWLKDLGESESLVPGENPPLDMLVNIQLSETRVERHVLGLGMGGYRMILFVLPQIRPPRDAKEHDFAQRRFSDSRLTVISLLSFLRELCGCDGPFYYQSLPTLTRDAFQRDIFYVRNEPISVEKAQKEYEVVTQLAWKLIRQRGSDGFVRKVMLAEKLLQDPLGTFASVMRDSAILGQNKGAYKRLAGGYRDDWKAQDLTEYARFIQQLSKFQEVR
ncbi:MAG: hypothetical protein AB1374_11605 [Bacillota bacterium]